MPCNRKNPKLNFVPLDIATVPPGGMIQHYKDKWWAIDPEYGLIFWEPGKISPGSPQCNANEDTARTLTEKVYPWAYVAFLPSVFVRLDLRDYE